MSLNECTVIRALVRISLFFVKRIASGPLTTHEVQRNPSSRCRVTQKGCALGCVTNRSARCPHDFILLIISENHVAFLISLEFNRPSGSGRNGSVILPVSDSFWSKGGSNVILFEF